MMMTIRTHDQFNTTIYGLNDRYRGILNERRVILMNVQDIDNQGFSIGKLVNIRSHHHGVVRSADSFIVVEFDIPRGCVATYFPEANALVPIDKIARESKTPASKSVVVTLEKV
jgi:anaerobic selenocysteine-containing dehydrogenase